MTSAHTATATAEPRTSKRNVAKVSDQTTEKVLSDLTATPESIGEGIAAFVEKEFGALATGSNVGRVGLAVMLDDAHSKLCPEHKDTPEYEAMLEYVSTRVGVCDEFRKGISKRTALSIRGLRHFTKIADKLPHLKVASYALGEAVSRYKRTPKPKSPSHTRRWPRRARKGKSPRRARPMLCGISSARRSPPREQPTPSQPERNWRGIWNNCAAGGRTSRPVCKARP